MYSINTFLCEFRKCNIIYVQLPIWCVILWIWYFNTLTSIIILIYNINQVYNLITKLYKLQMNEIFFFKHTSTLRTNINLK